MIESWRYELTGQAERDLRQLDRAVRQRVLRALDRFVAKTGPGPILDPERGDVRRLRGSSEEYRLRIGDWRVRFTVRLVVEPMPPPDSGEVIVHVVDVLRVLPRGRAYRD